MTSYRADQVGEQVREEIMSIIRRELKDPRIGFVSITSVRMSPDLRQARVRVSVLGNPEQQKEAMIAVGDACGWLLPPPLTQMSFFVPGFADTRAEPPHGVVPQLVLFFDSGNLERSGESVKQIAAHATIVNVDHHPSNSRFGDL